jgi:hypothetical protein
MDQGENMAFFVGVGVGGGGGGGGGAHKRIKETSCIAIGFSISLFLLFQTMKQSGLHMDMI